MVTWRVTCLLKGAFREGTFGRRSRRGPRARIHAIRSRAALGHRSTGKRTGLHGACLTRGVCGARAKHLVRRALRKPGSGAEPAAVNFFICLESLKCLQQAQSALSEKLLI